jgi:hypothetical protein
MTERVAATLLPELKRQARLFEITYRAMGKKLFWPRSAGHYTPESKERQREGCRRGGLAPKHYAPETYQKRIKGSRLGGLRRRGKKNTAWGKSNCTPG